MSTKTNKYIQKQVKAIRLMIGTAERERRRRYAAGHAAYLSGIRQSELDSGGITGMLFQWVETDHASYMEYTDAIQQMEDLIEILTDPPIKQMMGGELEQMELAGMKKKERGKRVN